MKNRPKNSSSGVNKTIPWNRRAKIYLWNTRPRECAYCKIKLSKSKATVDHVYPKSKGGLFVGENLALSCKPCNEAKKDIVITNDWIKSRLVHE